MGGLGLYRMYCVFVDLNPSEEVGHDIRTKRTSNGPLKRLHMVKMNASKSRKKKKDRTVTHIV